MLPLLPASDAIAAMLAMLSMVSAVVVSHVMNHGTVFPTRGNKWKLSNTPRGKQVLKELKNTIGAWSLSLESFLEDELISALIRAIEALDDEGAVDGSVAFDDMLEEDQEKIQARRFEVFAEAEKVLFAPDEEKKNFKWLNKKYEKSGLRKKWT